MFQLIKFVFGHSSWFGAVFFCVSFDWNYTITTVWIDFFEMKKFEEIQRKFCIATTRLILNYFFSPFFVWFLKLVEFGWKSNIFVPGIGGCKLFEFYQNYFWNEMCFFVSNLNRMDFICGCNFDFCEQLSEVYFLDSQLFLRLTMCRFFTVRKSIFRSVETRIFVDRLTSLD